ncbi:MAG: three-Cys-motif partner protein TcmP [Pyrinomonadaceae bacterium]
MPLEDFYDERTEQSEVKAEIVRKYFWAWAKAIIPYAKKRGVDRIAYADLFAGRGRYNDGTKSTPLLVLEAAIREPEMSRMLVAVFNDADEDNAQLLESEIKSLPDVANLKHQPKVWNYEVGNKLVSQFENAKYLPPTLLFVDPWGYKGLSIRLVGSVLKHWGCDCIFFFNYRRINMSLSNSVFIAHMNDLFGEERANKLRPLLEKLSPQEREFAIVNELTSALKEVGGEYVLPFCFKNDAGTRTTHHLIFVSKNVLGYKIMKDIMAGESSTADQGVASFVYCSADKRFPYLFEYTRPLDDLVEMLLGDFAGQTLTRKQIFESHHVGKPYVEKNYRDALIKLEAAGRIITTPPANKRKLYKGEVSFGEKVQVKFPDKKS